MRLIGLDKLKQLRSRGEHIEKWVRAWVAEVRNANWKHPADVADRFRNARYHGDGQFVFPVGDCESSICVVIAFPQGIALITHLKAETTYGT